MSCNRKPNDKMDCERRTGWSKSSPFIIKKYEKGAKRIVYPWNICNIFFYKYLRVNYNNILFCQLEITTTNKIIFNNDSQTHHLMQTHAYTIRQRPALNLSSNKSQTDSNSNSFSQKWLAKGPRCGSGWRCLACSFSPLSVWVGAPPLALSRKMTSRSWRNSVPRYADGRFNR